MYIFNRLVEANLTKNKAIVEEVIHLMSTLREGWAGIKPVSSQNRGEPRPDKKRVDMRG